MRASAKAAFREREARLGRFMVGLEGAWVGCGLRVVWLEG